MSFTHDYYIKKTAKNQGFGGFLSCFFEFFLLFFTPRDSKFHVF